MPVPTPRSGRRTGASRRACPVSPAPAARRSAAPATRRGATGSAWLAALLALGLAGCAASPTAPQPLPRDLSGLLVDGAGPQVPAQRAPLGRPHDATTLVDPERRAQLEADLAAAWAAHEADPSDEDALVWLGRRLAYLGRYREAVAVYTEGLARHPDSVKLLRHRGHRLITLLRLDEAVADLSRAAGLLAGTGTQDELEPDGAPNASGVPRSTLHSNVFYHLGLAHLLRGEWTAARAAYEQAYAPSSVNDDMLVATSWWLYLTLRTCGEKELAETLLMPIHPDMDVLENHAYHALLLCAKGEREPDQVLEGVSPGSLEFATRGYGLTWLLRWRSRWEPAAELLLEVVAADAWPAFGALAAECELARVPSDVPLTGKGAPPDAAARLAAFWRDLAP